MSKILVIGSGLNSTIDNNLYDSIYASNTSFLRLNNIDDINLVISDALLFEESNLNQHPAIKGLSREASNKLRLEKYSKLNDIKLKRLIISDSNLKIKIKSRVSAKNIAASKLEIIKSNHIWNLYLSAFNLFDLLDIFRRLSFKLKIKFIAQFIMRKRMSTEYRPSLGLISIMLAIKENPNSKIIVDGIGQIESDGSRKAYYGSSNPFLYMDKSHMFDTVYLSILLKTNHIQLN